MDKDRTDEDPRGTARWRRALAIAAIALGFSAAVAAPALASADPATPVQGTPAPGWAGTPVEEKCVVVEPGDGPHILELDGGELDGAEFEDRQHRPVDDLDHRPPAHLVPVPGGAEPGWSGPGGCYVVPAPGPACDGAAAPGHGDVVRATAARDR